MYSCKICDLQFSKEHQRWNHVVSVHKIRKQCQICSKSYSSNIRLEEHLRTHTGERPLKCNLCTKAFGRKGSFRNHLQTHLGEAGMVHCCSICGKGFNLASNLSRHKRTHTKVKLFQCGKCIKQFKSKSELKQHEKRHMERKHKCTCCSFKFHTASELRRHMITHEARSSLKCTTCDKVFSSKESLKNHVKLLHNAVRADWSIYDCIFCGKGHIHLSNLQDHILTHTKEKPYKCEIRGKDFSTNGGKFTHIRGVHTAERVDKCNQCGKLFGKKGDLARHVLRHAKPTEGFKCEIRGNFRSTEKRLLRHQRLAHVRCVFCEKMYNGQRDLFTHLRTHTNERPISCEVCGKEHFSTNAKNLHIVYLHTLEKAYSCDICGYRFSLKGGLMRHLKTHE